LCVEPLGACATKPCGLRGECTNTANGYFSCLCDAGVTGLQCDRQIFFADTNLEISEEIDTLDHQISLAVKDVKEKSQNVSLMMIGIMSGLAGIAVMVCVLILISTARQRRKN